MNLLIINGPNLNLLGKREPEIYGSTTMNKVLDDIKASFPEFNIDYFQSNIEGELINRLQEDNYDALIINPGAYTHYAFALADCLKNIKKNKIEVHISNIYTREEYRQKSVTAPYCNGVITGFGVKGYQLAIQSIILAK